MTETSSPETWDNGHTCYDTIAGDAVWVVVDGVQSNMITVPSASSPPPPANRSVHIGWSSSHPSWITMTLTGFSPGAYSYSCDFGSGGDQSFTLTETSSPETWDNGHTCYDTIAGDAVESNTITVPSASPPQPPSQSVQIGWSGSHSGWIWMTLNGFPTGSCQCWCDFGSGGDEAVTLGETSEPETWDNGHTCYDLIRGDTVWVTVNGVRSNTITVP